jgi:hypothetical protein
MHNIFKFVGLNRSCFVMWSHVTHLQFI